MAITVTAARSEFAELLQVAEHTAVHLEMRDAYDVDDPSFEAWRAGLPYDRSRRDAEWRSILAGPVRRGVQVRRARIVSEPPSDYIRYEHEITDAANIAAGEQVRWLPRHRTRELALPRHDFWLFDRKTVRFNRFTEDGRRDGTEIITEPAVAKLCAAAFDAVWAHAVPHGDYRLT